MDATDMQRAANTICISLEKPGVQNNTRLLPAILARPGVHNY